MSIAALNLPAGYARPARKKIKIKVQVASAKPTLASTCGMKDGGQKRPSKQEAKLAAKQQVKFLTKPTVRIADAAHARWRCMAAIHTSDIVGSEPLAAHRVLGSAQQVTHTHKFVSGHVGVGRSCVAFDTYSFAAGQEGYFLGPVHVRSHCDPAQRSVLKKPIGGHAGTPIYGVVVPVPNHHGRYRFASAIVANELAFFCDALHRGLEYVHLHRDKMFFPDGRGDLFAAACLLMGDAHTLMYECLLPCLRPKTHRAMCLAQPPVHFALLLACFSGAASVFDRFASLLRQRSSSIDPQHMGMLQVYLPSAHCRAPLTRQCVNEFVAAQRAEANERRARVLGGAILAHCDDRRGCASANSFGGDSDDSDLSDDSDTGGRINERKRSACSTPDAQSVKAVVAAAIPLSNPSRLPQAGNMWHTESEHAAEPRGAHASECESEGSELSD